MEEAEVLGDTICILANGKLQKTGSPLELKRTSGSGYRLKLEAHESNFLKEATLSEIRKFISTASLENIVKPTVYINLPYDFNLKYHDMLHSLEGAKDRLGIITISIADTSLERVFLNCAGEADQVDNPDGTRNSQHPLIHSYKRLGNIQPNFLQLCSAIFYKKFTFLTKEWKYTAIMLSLPIVSIVFSIMLMHYMSVVKNDETLPLKLSQLRTGTIYIYNPSGYDGQFEQQLRQYIQQNGINAKTLMVRRNFTIMQELKQMQRDNLADFLEDTIGVISIYGAQRSGEKSKIEMYWESNRYHSSIILLNMLDTCILQQLDGQEKAFISAKYLPIRRFINDVSSSRLEYFVVIVAVANVFYMFYYIVLPFREHVNGFYQLQPMSRFTYWWATFIFDMLLHGIVCLTLLLIQRLIMPDELYKIEDQKLIAWSVFFYGCSYLPILYVLGNNFESISTISTYILFMLIVSEIAPLITSTSVQAMKFHETKIAFLRFLPDFNLNHQLRIINENLLAQRKKSLISPESTGIFFAYALTVFFVVMGFFTIVIENKYYRRQLIDFFRGKSCKLPAKSSPTSVVNDTSSQLEMGCMNDCNSEEQQVKQLLADNERNGNDKSHNYPLIVSDLRKSYAGKHAVCGISFAAKPGECFGLLGVNGAGKTTTFEMITANKVLDSGHIQIKGIDVRQNEVLFRQQFGYCPQYDALNQFMTAEQCLRLMALLRGLPLRSEDSGTTVKNNVEYWLNKMNLTKYRDVAVKCYSGGTKRKLLAAMAMIGEPPLLLLDEPTTGVDPISRRLLWECIKDFQAENRTVVLTSHSMDECEELCNRLAIMANGKFKCLNNICALKRLSGFTIKLKMRIDMDSETNITKITDTLKEHFKQMDLRESHAGTLTYFICTDEQILWSKVFKITEEYLGEKHQNLVEYYSVNECTLEDIFLKFERQSKSLTHSSSVSHNYI
ncbi:ATP-binding cassette sub-family A member 2 isoform X2 [Drosophila hydei]|nr:ATP-binding cassette sub-family A member 2 isoform X2 [Drosophila hydei]